MKPCGNVFLPLCASQLVGLSSTEVVPWWIGGGARVVVTCVASIPSIHPWTVVRCSLLQTATRLAVSRVHCPVTNTWMGRPGRVRAADFRFRPLLQIRSLSGDGEVHGRPFLAIVQDQDKSRRVKCSTKSGTVRIYSSSMLISALACAGGGKSVFCRGAGELNKPWLLVPGGAVVQALGNGRCCRVGASVD